MPNASGNFLFDMPVSWEYNSKNPRLKFKNIILQKEVLNISKFVMNALNILKHLSSSR